MTDESLSWFAAVAWGSEKHQACILDAKGDVAGEREFPHSGTGLTELCDWLLSVACDTSAVAVAIETPHGPVVDALLDRRCRRDRPGDRHVALTAGLPSGACGRDRRGDSRDWANGFGQRRAREPASARCVRPSGGGRLSESGNGRTCRCRHSRQQCRRRRQRNIR